MESHRFRRWMYSAIAPALLGLALVACGGGSAQQEIPAQQVAEESIVEVPPEPSDNETVGGAVFVIVSEESEARFIIDEVLNGAPTTVVGVTNAITGTVAVDYAQAVNAQVGTIQVDLSTLVTDNNFRNRALTDFILVTSSPENQFATFEATSITGLPESAFVGETYPLQITGSLTVKGSTTDITFEGTVTPVSETRLEGSATTTTLYPELGVSIPRLPEQVASVEEEITLELDFVAVAS